MTRRDARLEGEPESEPGTPPRLQKTKDAQRDLTSLSGPVDPGDGRDGEQ